MRYSTPPLNPKNIWEHNLAVVVTATKNTEPKSSARTYRIRKLRSFANSHNHEVSNIRDLTPVLLRDTRPNSDQTKERTDLGTSLRFDIFGVFLHGRVCKTQGRRMGKAFRDVD